VLYENPAIESQDADNAQRPDDKPETTSETE